MKENFSPSYLKLAWASLIFIFLVIIAGSVVRSTGSGMGCPDWPTCFGQVIPPTSESQLPENYKEQYQDYRQKKVLKFAKLLTSIGLVKTSEALLQDETLMIEQDFNPQKTWVEYGNRLVGFIAGNLVLILFIWTAIRYRKKHALLYLTFLNLVLMGFEGWFGSIVVATNLLPWTITLHMLLALIIVGIQIKIIRIIQNSSYAVKINKGFKTLFYITLLLTFIQIVFGAQVRQEVDFMVKDALHRSDWIANMKGDFYFHRSFSWVILVCTVLLFYFNNKWKIGIPTIKFMLAFVLLEFITGILFSYADMPSFTQPFHLLAATCLLGLQYYSLKYFQFKRDSI